MVPALALAEQASRPKWRVIHDRDKTLNDTIFAFLICPPPPRPTNVLTMRTFDHSAGIDALEPECERLTVIVRRRIDNEPE